jgi:hypothetical protein
MTNTSAAVQPLKVNEELEGGMICDLDQHLAETAATATKPIKNNQLNLVKYFDKHILHGQAAESVEHNIHPEQSFQNK